MHARIAQAGARQLCDSPAVDPIVFQVFFRRLHIWQPRHAPRHRSGTWQGRLPSAALLDEIGRSTDATKRAYSDGLLVVIDNLAARLAWDDPHSARVKTLSVFAQLVGTLQVSRALANRQVADDVLEQGIQNALALLGAEHQS